ncbi:cytochrome P450 2J6 isoform X3 [Cricetulus griseus]|uniref:Cytochrome P450 2J6 isoform X3 n=1 Tax=Cricetulus griseus TaxID=10029 RepID=A0A9J7GN62_CRIGR|nr:cytochrome P450 2J6 isoform X3 [Cricetulus griseus]XP_035313682.1 cytochrome P450 2J6 isoform X3 [Cricetulus griseus]
MLAAAGSLVAAFWATFHLRTLILAVVTFLFLADYLKNRRPKNYPPGPRGLPFVGSIFQLDFDKAHLSIQPFVKKYGNIFSLNLGDITSVVITGLPLIKEVFTHMEENILTRPVTLIRKRISNNNGLVFSSGQTWKEQRRFALMTLRNFGLGKKSLEQRMQEEARYLVEAIKVEGGQPFNPHFSINNAVSNIICSVTFGERFEYHDSQFQEMLRLLDEATCLEATHSLLQYPDKTTTSFNEENLICSTLDLFFAGTETTSTTLRWALLYMALYPEVQEKVQAEIDRVIGQKRQPSLADRESMPYTNAVVHEVQRMGNIIPLNVPREVAKDTDLDGFHLTKERGLAWENNWPGLSCSSSSLLLCKNSPSSPQLMRS